MTKAESILSLADAGVSLCEIAEFHRLHPSRVAAIVRDRGWPIWSRPLPKGYESRNAPSPNGALPSTNCPKRSVSLCALI